MASVYNSIANQRQTTSYSKLVGRQKAVSAQFKVTQYIMLTT